MKKMFFLITMSLVFAGLSFAQCECTRSLITTTGVGEIKAVPDEVNLLVEIENFAKDAPTSKAGTEDRLKAVLATIQQFGIESKDFQTQRLVIEPRHKKDDDTKAVIGFVSSVSISVKLRAIDKLSDFYSKALAAGATSLSQASYGTSELLKHRAAARALAINAARDKARFLAEQLGQKIGRAFTVTELSGNELEVLSEMGLRARSNVFQYSGASGEMPNAVGVIRIIERVTVSFELN